MASDQRTTNTVCTAVALTAVNSASGQVLWETRRYIASDFVVVGRKVYAVWEDDALIAYDLGTGHQVGSPQFSGGRLDILCGAEGVFSDGSRILVYFGDTRELIALGPDQPRTQFPLKPQANGETKN